MTDQDPDRDEEARDRLRAALREPLYSSASGPGHLGFTLSQANVELLVARILTALEPPSPTGEAGEQTRCKTCGGGKFVRRRGVGESGSLVPCPECASESKEARNIWPCENCGTPNSCPASDMACAACASESKSGGEGAGETWTIYRDDQGFIRARGPDLLNGPRFAEAIEVCPASDLTEALSLLAEARAQLERVKSAASLEATSGEIHYQARTRAEAQLAQVREVAEWARGEAKEADERAKRGSGLHGASIAYEDVADRLDRALSNTTPETRDGQEEE